ncbi:hypothetical protein DMC14_000335 [Metamycoplasma phocicerebrale]|uniref:Lipoprotein n=1 Tax=Metamycoplasma phocicerebrale TaxID=142649 RepID=A0A3Q9VBC3_9BACT|nr:hypothetical protein [Metamycoplasma phocicerebrale]AZZ65257.1 hypothetical protein DMC14_000335 [Metamycoplasma phocicerebrale]
MINKIKKILKLGAITTFPLIATSIAVVSCSKNKINSKNKSQDFYNVKNKIDNLTWKNNFLLAKKMESKNINYKDHTYETFFEFSIDGLDALNNIEINEKTENLKSIESKNIDKYQTASKYLNKDIIDLIDLYNKDKSEDNKLIIILRSQKLAPPESAILVWVWLTEKKYLNNTGKIQDLKYYSSLKVPIYGHWFYNEEYDKSKKNNKVWKILSYVVPSIAIGGLIMYVVIMLLIKRKKTFKINKSKREDKK